MKNIRKLGMTMLKFTEKKRNLKGISERNVKKISNFFTDL